MIPRNGMKIGVQLLRSSSTLKKFVDALVERFTTITIIDRRSCKKNPLNYHLIYNVSLKLGKWAIDLLNSFKIANSPLLFLTSVKLELFNAARIFNFEAPGGLSDFGVFRRDVGGIWQIFFFFKFGWKLIMVRSYLQFWWT